jgi:hypothetical protein
MPKQNPQGWGTLGGSYLESRPLTRVWGVGDGDTRKSNVEIGGATSRSAIALWCDGIAPWYATGVAGQYVSVRQPFDYSGILYECRDIFSMSLCASGKRFPILMAMNSPEIKKPGLTPE